MTLHSLVEFIDNPVQLVFTGGVNPHGAYDNVHAYATGDSVSYLGSSYVAIQATTGNLPTNTTFWQVLANKGAEAFVYIAYAADDTGTDFTLTFNAALDYIAILETTIEIPSPIVGDFAGLWKNYKGAPGVGVGGQGVPAGGSIGDMLVKNSGSDYDIKWGDLDDLSDSATTNKFTSTVEKTHLKNISSTGLLFIGPCSVNADPTKWNIGAGSCRVIDNYTDPDDPIEIVVTWDAQAGLTPPGLTTSTWESFGINASGGIEYQPDDAFSFEARRDIASIGYVTHEGMDIIQNVHVEPVCVVDTLAKIDDHLSMEGHKIFWGHVASASSGLMIKMSEGVIFGPGINYENNHKDPNYMYTSGWDTDPPTHNPCMFKYFYRDGVDDWINDLEETTYIDPEYYDDDSGVLHAVTSGYWTIQPLSYYAPMDACDLQYGQTEYATRASAIAAVDNHIEINPYNSYDVLRGWIVVQQGATDLTDLDQAVFIEAPRKPMSDLQTGGDVSAEITNHNDTDNIQGGLPTERNHLSNAELWVSQNIIVEASGAPAEAQAFIDGAMIVIRTDLL